MIEIGVTTEKETMKKLREMTTEFPNLTNAIVAEISKSYAEFQKKNYLNNQYLHKVTGKTFDSVKFYKQKKGVFVVRPGAGVNGSLNYLAVYEKGGDSLGREFPWEPFVTDSREAFFSSMETSRIAGNIISEYWRKKFKEGAA